jgi:hypothetical protein
MCSAFCGVSRGGGYSGGFTMQQYAREGEYSQRLSIFGTLPRTSDTIHNPLSAISNEAPALVNNEVSPKPLVGTKKQRLMLYDTNKVMVSFAASNQQSKFAFQEMMKCKMEAEKEKAAIEKNCFLMFLIKKKASIAISNEEFELFKNT